MLKAHLGQLLSYDPPGRVVASTCQAPSLQQNRSKIIKIINKTGNRKKAVENGEEKGTGMRRGSSLAILRIRLPICSCTLGMKVPRLHWVCSSWAHSCGWCPGERKRRVVRLTGARGLHSALLFCPGMRRCSTPDFWIGGCMGWDEHLGELVGAGRFYQFMLPSYIPQMCL